MLTSTSLCNILQIAVEFEFINTLMYRFTILSSLFNWAFSTSASYTHSPNDKTLLSFVPKSSSFIRPCGPWCTMYCRELTEMPTSDAMKIPQCIRLLLAPDFSHVLVSTHLA